MTSKQIDAHCAGCRNLELNEIGEHFCFFKKKPCNKIESCPKVYALTFRDRWYIVLNNKVLPPGYNEWGEAVFNKDMLQRRLDNAGN